MTDSVSSPARAFERRPVFSWCLFDWANSPFPAIILTFVIPAYFAQAVVGDAATATSQWAFMTGAAALVIAFVSPILGSIADQGGHRKPWLVVFTVILAVGSALLWFVEPDAANAVLLLWLVGISVVAFEIGMVFYNALLPTLVPVSHVGRVSGWAWGLGYFGGLVAMILVLFAFLKSDPPLLGLDKDAAEHVRIVGPVVAVWLAVFCLPLFLWTPDPVGRGLPATAAIREGLAVLGRTLRALPRHGQLARFLLARMIFTDGLNTLFAFGGIYAAGTFGMSVEQVLMFGLVLNATAGAGAFAFGWIDDRIGAKPTILIGLVAITALGVPLLLVETTLWFWILGSALGIFIGPVQSASRSMMARMTPPGMESEMFGLFALSGKATAFVGPWLVGLIAFSYGSQRIALATVIPFLVIGGLLLLTVRESDRPENFSG
ncbi:MAG: MFS transporter [Alphaproteobacteria bacterium]|nr:MFS transporter [Alphaproteobacteria bacterium]